MKKSKHIYRHPATFVWLAIIVIAAVSMILSTNDRINLLFWFIMVSFLNVAYVIGIASMHQMGVAAVKAGSRIANVFSTNPGEIRSFVSTTPELFDNPAMDDAFGRYRDEMNRISGHGGSVHCDIGDYINEELVDSRCAKGFLNQIPGIMTGLGILGTFVGLTVGLMDFDASTAEAMAKSIPPLMDGIKIAFFTSIFGVIFSILFNIAHNSEEQFVQEAIDSFLDEYYAHVIPDPESDIANEAVGYHREMLRLFREFTDKVTSELADIKKALPGIAYADFTEPGDNTQSKEEHTT